MSLSKKVKLTRRVRHLAPVLGEMARRRVREYAFQRNTRQDMAGKSSDETAGDVGISGG